MVLLNGREVVKFTTQFGVPEFVTIREAEKAFSVEETVNLTLNWEGLQDLTALQFIKFMLDNKKVSANLYIPFIPSVISFTQNYASAMRTESKQFDFINYFINFINGLNFSKVLYFDPADIGFAYKLNNSSAVNMAPYMQLISQMFRYDYIVCLSESAKAKYTRLGLTNILVMHISDAEKGSMTLLDKPKDFTGKNVLVVTDIAFGGKLLGKVVSKLKKQKCGKLSVYVSHCSEDALPKRTLNAKGAELSPFFKNNNVENFFYGHIVGKRTIRENSYIYCYTQDIDFNSVNEIECCLGIDMSNVLE